MPRAPITPLPRRRRAADKRGPTRGHPRGTELPELTVLARALGVLALCGWSVGVLVGLLMIKGNTEPFLLSNFFGNTGRMFLLGVMAGGRGSRGLRLG